MVDPDSFKKRQASFLACSKCGCDRFWISVTDKNPKEGLCCDCREVVDLSGRIIHIASPTG
jgi:hypothetical protein